MQSSEDTEMLSVEFLKGNRVSAIRLASEQNILEAALAHGIDVDFSCKRGDCNQCVATLLAGSVAIEGLDGTLTEAGEVHLCKAYARSDLAFRLPYAPETEHIHAIKSPCKIQQLVNLSADVLEVTLRLPPAAKFSFVPGQYIRLTNRDKVTRSYSLADVMRPDNMLKLHVRRVEQGAFSAYLFSDAKPGELLHLEGPHGHFVLSEHRARAKTIFLATGTGIAPIFAMLSSLAQREQSRIGSLFVYWGNSTDEDAYFKSQLIEVTGRLKAECFFVFSRDQVSSAQYGEKYVQELLAAHHHELSDAQVFASGNASMVESARLKCLSLGLSPECFYSDPFTPS